jgi:hypothetical protein
MDAIVTEYWYIDFGFIGQLLWFWAGVWGFGVAFLLTLLVLRQQRGDRRLLWLAATVPLQLLGHFWLLALLGKGLFALAAGYPEAWVDSRPVMRLEHLVEFVDGDQFDWLRWQAFWLYGLTGFGSLFAGAAACLGLLCGRIVAWYNYRTGCWAHEDTSRAPAVSESGPISGKAGAK